MDIIQEVENIYQRFKAAGIELEKEEIKSRLDVLVGQFRVPMNEASRTVVLYFRKEHNLRFDGLGSRGGDATVVPISDIKHDGDWVSIRAKAVQFWESKNELIAQTGLLGDESGIIKFTAFAKSRCPTLEEGKSYILTNLVASKWNDQMSVKLNKKTTISILTEDIKPSRREETMTGIISTVLPGSGLIKRCPECNRALQKGACGEHGRVDGVYDLRIKAVLEDCVPAYPPTTHDLIVGREATEKVTGISMDKAKTMATEALDVGVVGDLFNMVLVGRYYIVSGSLIGSNMIVNEMMPLKSSTEMADAAKEAVAKLGGN